jgi:beta-galactosidase
MHFKFEQGACSINGQPAYIRAGEIQYFRVPCESWEMMLNRLQEAGCNCLSTYIPWNWHCPDPQTVDFTGQTHPCRDLLTFLRLAAERGFLLILKPGPFVHNEMRNGGVPEWLCRQHPEMMSVGPDSGPPEYPSYPPITYLHPRYMKGIATWFSQVAELTRPYANRVLLWQIDNELSYSYTFFTRHGLGGDYNPFLVDDGLYQQFLEERFGTIDVINERYGTHHARIGEVIPPRAIAQEREAFLRVFDWIEFKEWLGTQFVKTCCDILHERGVAGPFMINAPFHGYFPLWPRLARELNQAPYALHICHCDYPGMLREGMWGEVVSRMEFCKASQQGFHGNNEIQACNVSRIWKDPGQSYDLLYKMLFGNGLTMANYYWFCDGENFLDYGVFMQDHSFGAPVAKDGSTRWHYGLIRRINEFLQRHPDCTRFRKQADVTVGFVLDYARMSMIPNSYGGAIYGETLALFNLLADSHISFDLHDLYEPVFGGGSRILLVPCGEFMPRALQQRLIDWATAGVAVMLVGRLPHLDENLHPCELLRDALGLQDVRRIEQFDRHANNSPRLVHTFGETVPVTVAVQTYRGAAVEELGACEDGVCCIARRALGQGSLLVVGFPVSDTVDAWRRFIRALTDVHTPADGCARFVLVSPNGQHAALHCLLNLGEQMEHEQVAGRELEVRPRQGVLVYINPETNEVDVLD